jgi:hypothetical protein
VVFRPPLYTGGEQLVGLLGGTVYRMKFANEAEATEAMKSLNCFPEDRDMDSVFYDVVGGGSVPKVLENYGPRQAIWLAGRRSIVFGLEASAEDPAAAYTAGAVGGVAVRAAAGFGDAARTLQNISETGAAGAALHSNAMRDALARVESGEGQVAALSIAANIVDKRTVPALEKSLLSGGELQKFLQKRQRSKEADQEQEIFYGDSSEVLEAARKALLGYGQTKYHLSTSASQILAHVYGDLIGRTAENALEKTALTAKAAWLHGLYLACETLKAKGGDLQKFLIPEVFQLYQEAAQQARPSSPAYNVGTIDLSRLPTHTGRERRNSPMPSHARVPDNPIERRKAWDAVVTKHLTAYADCMERGGFVHQSLATVLRERPYLTGVAQQNANAGDRDFQRLLEDPELLGTVMPRRTGNITQDAAVVAAAEAHAAPPEATRSRADGARKYLFDNIEALVTRSLTDISPAELEAYGITPEDIDKYFRVMDGGEAPSFLIQLATQVIVDNANSVVARGGKQSPPSKTINQWYVNQPQTRMRFATALIKGQNPTPKSRDERKLEKEYQEIRDKTAAYELWLERAGQIDSIAEVLHDFLQMQYQTGIASVEGFGQVFDHPDTHLKFRALAMCAQGEAQDILTAPAESQRLFAQRAGNIFSRINPAHVDIYFPTPEARQIYNLWARSGGAARPATADPLALPGLGRIAGRLRRPGSKSD